MASSAIQVCSNALLMLGQRSINAFAEDKTGLTANLWDTVRQSTLRMAHWSCARKRANLSALVSTPPFDWVYQFQLPPDLLRVVTVGSRNQTIDYELENGLLLSDEASIPLIYIFDSINPATWDALLVEAATIHMAWMLAYPITGSTTTRDAIGSAFNDFLKIARGVNNSEKPGETMGNNPLLGSRFSGSRFSAR